MSRRMVGKLKIKSGEKIEVSNLRKSYLLSISLDPAEIEVIGRYSDPRTYGVYALVGAKHSGRRFRFGNHPVRHNELARQYESVRLEALFIKRSDASELAALLNYQYVSV